MHQGLNRPPSTDQAMCRHLVGGDDVGSKEQRSRERRIPAKYVSPGRHDASTLFAFGKGRCEPAPPDDVGNAVEAGLAVPPFLATQFGNVHQPGHDGPWQFVEHRLRNVPRPIVNKLQAPEWTSSSAKVG
jgi:hypothetical protein